MAVQSTLKSLLAEGQTFQSFMDTTAAVFDTPLWKQFSTEEYTPQLTWKGITNTLESVPAATVIDFSGEKPISRRPAIGNINGDLLTMGDKFQMDKLDVRRYFELEAQIASGAIKGLDSTALMDILIPDLKIATLAPHQRIDYSMLETLSTGATTYTKTNNPKGITSTALDWDVNKQYASTVWGTAATAVPLTDIQTVVKYWRAKGVEMTEMLMNWTTFYQMMATTQMKELFGVNLTTAGREVTASSVPFVGVEQVSQHLQAIGMPKITIINKPINVEGKNGVYSSKTAFADYRITFVPSTNDLGKLMYSFANMQQVQDAQRDYATVDLVSIARWVDGDKEFTEYELNAMWVLNKSKSMTVFATNATS